MLALIDDHQQKLFEIGDSQKNLAYAVVGCTIDPSGFDLIKVVESQIARIRHRRFGDCRQYLLTLGDKTNSEINSAKQEGKIHAFPQLGRLEQSNAWKFARMEVAGYFDGRAILCRVEFFHYSRDRTEFSLFPYQHGAVLSVSIVQRAMYHRNGDPVAGSRFSEYAKRLGSDPSLDDAEEYAVGYVKACCSPLAVELDPKCNAMGGHIHVAEITTAGLKWRVPRSPNENPATWRVCVMFLLSMPYWLKIAICCVILVAFALLQIFSTAMENPLLEILSGVLSLVWIFALLWLIVLLGQVIRRKRKAATHN